MSDYFEGQLTALNSVIGVCKHNPEKKGKELEKVFRDMIEQLRPALNQATLRAYNMDGDAE